MHASTNTATLGKASGLRDQPGGAGCTSKQKTRGQARRPKSSNMAAARWTAKLNVRCPVQLESV